MLEYKIVTLEDKSWVEPIFKKCNRRGNEYTFANLFDWSKPQNIKIAKYKDCIVFKHFSKSSVYSCPIGNGNLPEVVEMLMEESHKYDDKLKLVNVDEFDAELIEKAFPGKFEIKERRNDFDYIYVAKDLGNLVGKRYHVKRNHMNKFMKTYPDWRYEEITRDNIEEVRRAADRWYEEAMETKEESIVTEQKAVMNAFDHYFELDLEGGIIYVGDNIAAFSFGSKSSDDTLVVHCEKGFLEYEGVYTMIAKEFSLAASKKGYKYVNREDDMGIEGLRISKLSYRPEFFYKRFEAKEV